MRVVIRASRANLRALDAGLTPRWQADALWQLLTGGFLVQTGLGEGGENFWVGYKALSPHPVTSFLLFPVRSPSLVFPPPECPRVAWAMPASCWARSACSQSALLRAELGALGGTGDCCFPWWVPAVLHRLLFAFTVSACTGGCCEGRGFVGDWLSKGAPGRAETLPWRPAKIWGGFWGRFRFVPLHRGFEFNLRESRASVSFAKLQEL